MPYFQVQIRTKSKKSVVGYKFVRASNKTFIRSHKSRYLGGDRNIGRIEAVPFLKNKKQVNKLSAMIRRG